MHGIALNVSTALDYDRLINPAGFTAARHHLARSARPDAHVTFDDAKHASC